MNTLTEDSDDSKISGNNNNEPYTNLKSTSNSLNKNITNHCATDNLQVKETKENGKHVPNATVPTSLQNSTVIQTNHDHTDWLTQLANIATGPQSPLLQKRSPALAFNSLMHTYAKPPKSPEMPLLVSKEQFDSKMPTSFVEPERDHRVSSSSPFPTSPNDVESVDGSWSHTWPAAVWQCFMKGTQIRFTCENKWQSAEEIGRIELLATQAYQITNATAVNQSESKNYAPNGLMLERVEEIVADNDGSPEEMLLTFGHLESEQDGLQAICLTDHPFFVKIKGWSSYNPLLTVEKYGIPCSELETGDVCIPPSHPDAISFKESKVFESFKSCDLTPLDTSTVFALSSLARHRRDSESSQPRSAPPSPVKKARKLDPNRGFKRPMNAFMLFAKKFRLEYTQMYPGRDNRAISVVLGDEWKKLNTEQRKVYAEEAKSLAEEHKKNHPDCWKRKRHASSSV